MMHPSVFRGFSLRRPSFDRPHEGALDLLYRFRYRVSVCYDITTPEDSEVGEPSERGFHVESEECDGETVVSYLREYATHPAPRDFTTWWTCDGENVDPYSGALECTSVHVEAHYDGAWRRIDPTLSWGRALTLEAWPH